MDDCDKVNLLKVQGQYLRFIIDNNTELDILEHIERCEECRSGILEAVKNDNPQPDYGSLFQREFDDKKIPQYKDYKKPEDFIDARIQWRKKILKELVKNAEMELMDIETRLES
ncbi:hypothetical protein E4H04_06110 [Candidatus Bathyarchaeota archaeon]|jgi:hypothetical protein|nr:MAG: hypothetical protein E4H04_06110 [Candidatus Bathyarchaeota archaeon]